MVRAKSDTGTSASCMQALPLGDLPDLANGSLAVDTYNLPQPVCDSAALSSSKCYDYCANAFGSIGM